jgi:RNA polymerase subunit RPABC4/transcription elongation factor Spt4
MICSICNKTNLVEVWYGYPTPEILDLARLDMIALGGPITKPYTHFCTYCQETHPAQED